MNEVTTPCVSEQPAPNKLCPILMLCPPKTGRGPSYETYGDIVCLQDKCAMNRSVQAPVSGEMKLMNYFGLAGKP